MAKKGDTNQTFYEYISKKYDGTIPEASKDYMLPGTGNLEIKNENDLRIFNELYFESRSQGTGNGEVSLFWLFNCGPKRIKNFSKSGSSNYVQVNQGASLSAPDLKFDEPNKHANATPDNNPGTFAEIKSFSPSAFATNKETLTRYGRFTTFIDMVNLLSAADNLVGDNLIDEGNTTGLQNINYDKLVQAAENFCELRSVISKNYLQRYKIFKKMVANMEEFDRLAATDPILKPCQRERPGQNRPGGELIAKRLVGYLVLEAIGQKPGFGSYMVNVPDQKGSRSKIEFLQIIKENFNLDAVADSKNVVITAGRIEIKFHKLFKK